MSRSVNRIVTMRFLLTLTTIGFAFVTTPLLSAEEPSVEQMAILESKLLKNARQITFEGRRAGEGYFSSDGSKMVFQSERDPSNPFYQIYLTDFETGDLVRVSPGFGKTTCAWIHPKGDKVLFASTQRDPEARKKQADEIALRESGKERRYAWDYDSTFELFETVVGTDQYRQLTDAVGYDAEASYSPDGSQIVFASNRAAYDKPLTGRAKQMFEVDPAYMIDIYIMNADGTNVRQLTDIKGYDGGPFFSSDGERICWRRFSEDGASAEIFTMRTDGSDVRRLTNIGAMSWAPFFHPSGDYLIFTTNRHGFANFELYLVRADGEGEPVRVSYTDGFDGLPVFLPNGSQISWTSTRTPQKQSQIFLADWDDASARELLGLGDAKTSTDRDAALAAAEVSSPDFRPADVMRHVDFLTRMDLGGRLTGTEGERRATAYVAAYLESLGFEPAGQNGTFFHTFEFPAGSRLIDGNQMLVGDQKLKLEKDYVPLSFSKQGQLPETGVVFAGYGLQVPAEEEGQEYDSYVHLNVAGQWVMMFRDLPQDISPETRQRMARYSSPRRKVTIARDLGARGVIFVAGPNSQVKNQLIRFDQDASQASVSIAAVSVTNEVAERILKPSGETISELQTSLDDGSLMMGFAVEAAKVSAEIVIERRTGEGRNVLARLPAGEKANHQNPVAMVGAHIDHLGVGGGGSSLAGEEEAGLVHFGADDNASGVAAMLEIAQYLAAEKKEGKLRSQRDLIVAAWSGEELGLFGSKAFVEDFYNLYPNANRPKTPVEQEDADSKAVEVAHAHGASAEESVLTQAVAAYLNLDMVGRLREKLVVQGIGSSPGFAGEVQRRNLPVGLPIQLDKASSRLPTDTSAFVGRQVPILSAFTGAHEDYHTPRDTPDKLNYEGAAKIANLMALITRGILTSEKPPVFELNEGDAAGKDAPRARLTAFLGTIPDYVAGDVKGLKLSGVSKEGPAAKAGVQGGDIIVQLAGRKIEDIYDYTYAIEALKIGEEVTIVVQRGEKTVTMKVTPAARE